MDDLRESIKNWFDENLISHAVVGWSGGVDSCTTALLLNECGIKVRLVVADGPNQHYSSAWGGANGASRLARQFGVDYVQYNYEFPCRSDTANEAAGPIMRTAIFYGEAANIRAEGHAAVVVGTINFSEGAFLGFWGKSSDAAQDLYPISHLAKHEVYELAKTLNVPDDIIHAVPSGDLFFEDTNDLKMIGATYDQINEVIIAADNNSENDLLTAMYGVNDPELFMKNITKNAFKYNLPMPGFHIKKRLERFRQDSYFDILYIAGRYPCLT